MTSETISDEQVLRTYPEVRLDHRNKEFYRALLDRHLVAAHCRNCGSWHTPLRAVCPECWSENIEVAPVSGLGRIHLLILLHQGPPARDVDYSTPWPLAAVEMAEQPGLRFVSTVVDCPTDQLRVGLPVELTWIERDGGPWYAFRPAKSVQAS